MSRIELHPDYKEFCQERLQNPYPLFDRLRDEDPVHWCEPMKLWLVTRYDDVLTGLKDTNLSSNRMEMYVQALPDSIKQRARPLLDHISKWIQLTDEPDHGRLRKLVNLAFTPKVIKALRGRIVSLTYEFLDAAPLGQAFDIVKQLCYPLPATVICELLGIPTCDRDAFYVATGRLMQFSTRGGPTLKDYAQEAGEALQQLVSMFRELVEDRRRRPREDLLSALVSAEADGTRLSNEELYAMCVFIFLAGHETTTNGLASGILALGRHPDQFNALKADPSRLVTGAVEEVLRFESPVTRAVRQARTDSEMSGKKIAAGQLVVLLLGAANRDPAQFAEPNRFDIARNPNRHLAFGYGIHFCLGAALARLEMEMAFGAIATRMPRMRLENDSLAWKPVMGIRALQELYVRV
jgi:pimeloyl-[acyl-carrier protein] synthase